MFAIDRCSFLQVKLTKISYIGNIFKNPVCTGFHFIHGTV